MAAPESRQEQRYGRAVLRLILVSLVALFLTSLLLLGTSAITSASQPAEASSQRPAIPRQTDTPVPTDTPLEATSTPVPTDTPVTVAPTATSTDGGVPTSTAVAGGTPVATGSGTVGTGGPQPTSVGLAQPTVGNGASGASQGISASDFGTNGLLIATLVGCVLAVLGITIGAFALNALVRSGYGPFLRALFRGTRRAGRKNRPNQVGRDARPRPPLGSTRTGYDDRYGHRDSRDAHGDPAGGRSLSTSRDTRQGRPGMYSGDRHGR